MGSLLSLSSLLLLLLRCKQPACLDEDRSRYEDTRQSPIYEEIHFPVPLPEEHIQATEHFLHEVSGSKITTHQTQITSSTSASGNTVTQVTTVTKVSGGRKVQQEVKVVKHKGSTTTQLFRQSKMSLKHFLDHRSEWRSMFRPCLSVLSFTFCCFQCFFCHF